MFEVLRVVAGGKMVEIYCGQVGVEISRPIRDFSASEILYCVGNDMVVI
jgi:hypothetical protein